jgi:peptidoglycan/LPS O-acetylase OafA/YrhL
MQQNSAPLKPVRFVDSSASVLFDLLRGLAAFLVLLEHWRNLFFVDFPQLIRHRLIFAVPYLLSSAGHQAVVVFFVLSGYFISGAVFRAVERNQWLWSDYLLRRLVRLWVVLVPALLLCLLWDKLGIYLGHSPALYGGNVNNHMTGNIHQLLAPSTFFGNLFFVQSILVPVFGSDGALWSLANEFWYYILFPLGLFTLRRATPIAHRLLYASLFFLVAWFVRGGILSGFPIWLMGTLLLFLPKPSFAPSLTRCLRPIAAVFYAVVFFALTKVHSIPGLLSDYLLTLFTFPFLWLLLSADRAPVSQAAKAVYASRELARFSYTLYAVHTPLLVFFVSLLIGDDRWFPTSAHILVALAALGAALLYAYALACAAEFRTDTLRQWLERLFHLPSPGPALPSNPALIVKNTRK